jgi:hypothetical protein
MVVGGDRCLFLFTFMLKIFFNIISKILDGHYSEQRAACGPYVAQACSRRCKLAHFGYTPLNLTIMYVHCSNE